MILATPDKAQDLAAIHAEAFDHSWDAAAIGDLLTAPGVSAVMTPDGEGFIMVRVIVDEAEILTLAVIPEARRRGLGRRLTDAAAQIAAAQGAVGLFLEVAADNVAALALYEAAGFGPAGRREGYYPRPHGPAIDALVMKRPLVPAA